MRYEDDPNQQAKARATAEEEGNWQAFTICCLEDDAFVEPVQTAELIEFKSLSHEMKVEAVPEVRKFIEDYIEGHFTGGALGNVKDLDKDEIVRYLIDMLHYDNKYLTVEAMNMLQRHFN